MLNVSRLSYDDVKISRPRKSPKELITPPDFLKAIRGNVKAKATFENFSNSNKKEYIQWIEEAKTEATRHKRILTAIEWMAEEKIKNWKYVKK